MFIKSSRPSFALAIGYVYSVRGSSRSYERMSFVIPLTSRTRELQGMGSDV